MLKIGNLKVSLPYILAPLAGISDQPFRMLNRWFGCELAFVEMISANGLIYNNKKTLKLIKAPPDDRPLGAQLLGANPDVVKRALEILQDYKFDLIDLNAACPVKKVITKGEGAGLMKNYKRLKEVLKVMVDNSKIPVTVKIRTGWDEKSINAKEVALHAQEVGVKAVFIHGRTKKQGHNGSVDYKTIKQVKEALDIPVIASGDISSPELIKKMFDETGCDGVTIARGALGNPWIFKHTVEFLRTGRVSPRPNKEEIINTMIKHLELCNDYYGEKTAPIIFRKFFIWYTKGFTGIKRLTEEASHAKSIHQMRKIIGELVVHPAP